MIGEFHFLRPIWLVLLPAALALAWIVSHREDMTARWRHAIAPHLLGHLLVDRRKAGRIRPVHLTILLLALGAIAAAGPTWRHERSPFVEDVAPLAIVIDLSRTMDATDIAPSRLERVKLKVRDLLAMRPGARTAIFVYAGSAHMVLPLTDDAKLIETYVDAVNTGIMPVAGKDTAKALAAVEEGLSRETVPGTILFMTDGVESAAFDAFAHSGGKNEIMLLAVGTPDGGPVRTATGDYLTDESGGRVFSRLDVDALKRLKSSAGVRLATITSDDEDVRWIAQRAATHLRQSEADAGTRWQDAGWWLLIPIALLGAFWFRQGWTVRWAAVVLWACLIAAPCASQAAEFSFADLWLTPDQQARLAFERGDFDRAAGLFADPIWKGVAAYRGGNYQDAIDAFARKDTAQAWFGQGNALAHLGKLPEALASYREALKKRPDWAEAKANADLVEKAIAAKPKDDDQESNEKTDKADQVQIDEKAGKGKKGVVDVARQTAEMWMRNIQVTPADLLARRFSIEARGATP